MDQHKGVLLKGNLWPVPTQQVGHDLTSGPMSSDQRLDMGPRWQGPGEIKLGAVWGPSGGNRAQEAGLG